MNIEFFFNGWQCSSLVVLVSYISAARSRENIYNLLFVFKNALSLMWARINYYISLSVQTSQTKIDIWQDLHSSFKSIVNIKLYYINIDGRRLSTHNDQLLILGFRKPTKSVYVDDLWWKLNWNLVGVSVFYLI